VKKAFIYTFLIVILYFIYLFCYGLVVSPMSGAVTASQLNDTASSYVIAKAFQENILTNTVGLICLLIVSLIWTPVIFGKNKN